MVNFRVEICADVDGVAEIEVCTDDDDVDATDIVSSSTLWAFWLDEVDAGGVTGIEGLSDSGLFFAKSYNYYQHIMYNILIYSSAVMGNHNGTK